MQDEKTQDWGEGLPLDILTMLAGGRDALKAMRGVNKVWQKGFERSIKTLRIGPEGPPLPADGTFSQRFPGLISLHLGDSPSDEADLAQLDGLKHLRILDLGGKADPEPGDADEGKLFQRLTEVGLQLLLEGLQLQQLSLRSCKKLFDQVQCAITVPLFTTKSWL